MPERSLPVSIGHLFARGALALALFGAAGAMSTALAQSAAGTDAGAAAPSHADDAKRDLGPLLTLQAAATEDVRQDTVQITVSAQAEAADQAAVGRKLNALLDELMKTAKGSSDVTARTGNYRVWPNSNNKGKVVGWQGEGSIVLESTNFEAASALATKMGDKSAITNINFTLSRKAREAVERKLLNQAAQAFRERALAAASAFGFSGYRLKELHLGGMGAVAPRAYMAMAKGAAAPAPSADVPLQADLVTVSVDVNGTIVLQ